MEPHRVFVSSIMSTTSEDLLAERAAARAAIEHFAPITTAWAFEDEPASAKSPLAFYIDAVKSSDLFVLIIARRLTKSADVSNSGRRRAQADPLSGPSPAARRPVDMCIPRSSLALRLPASPARGMRRPSPAANRTQP